MPAGRVAMRHVREVLRLGPVDKRSSETVEGVIQGWSLRRPVDAWRPDECGMGNHRRFAAA
jgi:hypothetical protein